MGIFGKKGKKPGDSLEFEPLEDVENDASSGLSAGGLRPPGMDAGGQGKGRAKLLALLLAVAGLGGGYIYLTSSTSKQALSTATPPVVSQTAEAPSPADISGNAIETSEDDLVLDFPPMPPVGEKGKSQQEMPGLDELTQEADLAAGEVMQESAETAAKAIDTLETAGEDMAAEVETAAEEALVETMAEDGAEMDGLPDLNELENIALEESAASSGAENVSDPADLPPPSDADMAAALPADVNEDIVKPSSEPVSETMVTPAENVEAPSEDLLLSEPTIAELAMLEETATPEVQATDSQPAPQEPEEPVKQDLGATGGDDKTIKATGAEMKPKPANVRPLPRQYLVVTKDKDSNDPDTRLTAARRALTQGNNAAALQMFNDLYADNPRDTRVLLGRAVAYQRLGQREMAIAAYEETLRRDPQRLDALTNFLGLLREQNPDLALQKLQELHTTYPSNPDVSAQLGLAYGDMGNYDRALSYLDMALTLAPNTPAYLFNKAVVLDRMGQRIEAADMYREVLRHADRNTTLPIDSIRNRLSVIR